MLMLVWPWPIIFQATFGGVSCFLHKGLHTRILLHQRMAMFNIWLNNHKLAKPSRLRSALNQGQNLQKHHTKNTSRPCKNVLFPSIYSSILPRAIISSNTPAVFPYYLSWQWSQANLCWVNGEGPPSQLVLGSGDLIKGRKSFIDCLFILRACNC